MLLQRLVEYDRRMEANDGENALPPMYQHVPVRYVIRLHPDGSLLSVPFRLEDRGVASDPKSRRGATMPVPDRRRTATILPKLLADNGEYTLGIARETSNPERVHKQHRAYVELVERCAHETEDPAVIAVARFLATLDLRQLMLDDFDLTASIVFEVDGYNPVNSERVQRFWAREASAADGEADPMQCLVCGREAPVVERMAVPIKGIPGGQASGTVVISANSPAFKSYGLTASLVAPTCEECGLRFGNALNRLLHDPQAHIVAGDLIFVHWTGDGSDLPLLDLLTTIDPEQIKAHQGPAAGVTDGGPSDATPLYVATLSANISRVIVRDWIETTTRDALRNISRYRAWQRLVDGTGQTQYFSFWQLIGATKNVDGAQEAAPQVGQILMRWVLLGGRLPDWLLYQVVRRVRMEQAVRPAHAALIKMVLLSQQYGGDPTMGSEDDMAALDPDHPEVAYHCGRLLAEYESIQRHAYSRHIANTIVDRYFALASIAPAPIFRSLKRRAETQLTRLRQERRGVASHEQRLEQIHACICPDIPATLDLRGQGLFALGYYHQRMANIRASIRASHEAADTPASESATMTATHAN